jgi:membrane protein YdbS with pleckstrin-like domain
MSQEYEPVSTNDDGTTVDEGKSKRAYALSAIMLLLFSILIMASHANLNATTFGGAGWKSVYLISSVITMLGCVLALLFYCCDLPGFIKFVIGLIVFTGGAMFFMGGASETAKGHAVVTACSKGPSTLCNQLRSYYIALPFFVLMESTILAMQIGTEIISTEERRIRAQVIALFTYGICRAIFWYGFYQKNLTSGEKAAEASLFLLMLSCAVVFLFHGLCCNIEAKWFRVMNAVVMSISAFMYLVVWSYLAGQQSLGTLNIAPGPFPLSSAQKLKMVTPAIFVFMEVINLSVEVGYVG